MSDRLENNKVAARYAKALFDSVVGQGQTALIMQDLVKIERIFAEVPALVNFLENPGIPMEEKMQLVEQQFTKELNPTVGRLLLLLVENNRISVFSALATQFTALVNQHENTTQAEIVTAVELEAELRERIRKTLESTFGFSRVDIQNRVDPGLLGGAIIKIQDQVIDGSYIGRLEELRKQISKL